MRRVWDVKLLTQSVSTGRSEWGSEADIRPVSMNTISMLFHAMGLHRSDRSRPVECGYEASSDDHLQMKRKFLTRHCSSLRMQLNKWCERIISKPLDSFLRWLSEADCRSISPSQNLIKEERETERKKQSVLDIRSHLDSSRTDDERVLWFIEPVSFFFLPSSSHRQCLSGRKQSERIWGMIVHLRTLLSLWNRSIEQASLTCRENKSGTSPLTRQWTDTRANDWRAVIVQLNLHPQLWRWNQCSTRERGHSSKISRIGTIFDVVCHGKLS